MLGLFAFVLKLLLLQVRTTIVQLGILQLAAQTFYAGTFSCLVFG